MCYSCSRSSIRPQRKRARATGAYHQFAFFQFLLFTSSLSSCVSLTLWAQAHRQQAHSLCVCVYVTVVALHMAELCALCDDGIHARKIARILCIFVCYCWWMRPLKVLIPFDLYEHTKVFPLIFHARRGQPAVGWICLCMRVCLCGVEEIPRLCRILYGSIFSIFYWCVFVFMCVV